MAEKIDDISLNWSDENGVLVRKEIEKEILTRGSWTTIVFLYQELNRKTNEFGPPKVSIRRYKKGQQGYRDQSRFNITNQKQAYQIMDVLKKWFPEDPRNAEEEKKPKTKAKPKPTEDLNVDSDDAPDSDSESMD